MNDRKEGNGAGRAGEDAMVPLQQPRGSGLDSRAILDGDNVASLPMSEPTAPEGGDSPARRQREDPGLPVVGEVPTTPPELEDAFKHIGDSFEALIGDIELYNPSTAGRLRSLVEKERAAFDSVLKDLVADFNGAQDARAELEAALAAKESELVEVKKAERQERADKVSANEEIDELVAALRAKTEELERVEDGWKRTNAAILERARKAEADNDRLRAVMLEAASSIASGPLLPKQIAARLREEAGK